MFSATRQSRDPISHGRALFQKPRICTLVPGIVVNDGKKSSPQKSLPHKPACDPFYACIQPSTCFFLAITCCSFGPIGRPDVLQLPLVASAESWSKIDSEGTIVGEVVAWVFCLLPWRLRRLQANAAVAKPLTCCDLDSGLQPQILSPHCAPCAVCMQHAPLCPASPLLFLTILFTDQVAEGVFSSCDNQESLQFRNHRYPYGHSEDLPTCQVGMPLEPNENEH